MKLTTIPYYPQLGRAVGGISVAIVIQQLEYWFEKTGTGFYKFLEPCENSAYKIGDSWTEELGMTKSEFKTAFLKIGTTWKSKKEFDETEDKFQGKLYCSYVNKIERKTYYFRNDKMVTDLISRLEQENETVESENSPSRKQQSESPEIKNSTSKKAENRSPLTVNYLQETTQEITTKNHDHDCDEVLKKFEELFKEEFPEINFTTKNQESIKKLLGKMLETEVIDYLRDTYSAVMKSKAERKEGLFSYKIAKEERQLNSAVRKKVVKEPIEETTLKPIEPPITRENFYTDEVVEEIQPVEKLRVSKDEYETFYKNYLKEINAIHSKATRICFEMQNKSRMEVIYE